MGSCPAVPGKCCRIPGKQVEINRRVLKPCGDLLVLPSVSGMCSLLPTPGLGQGGAAPPSLPAWAVLAPREYFGSTEGPTVGRRGTASQHRGGVPKVWDLMDFPISTPWSHWGSPSSAPAGPEKRTSLLFPQGDIFAKLGKNTAKSPQK